jgi:ribosomal protein S18 acetylase RimI-like enzyme
MHARTSPQRGLGPQDVGFRVVVRRRLASGQATDVLGELLAAEAGMLLVRRAAGELVEVEARSVLSAKRVPPGPARLRPARPADAESIEALRVRCWGTAYRGMIPDDFLDGLPAGLAARGVARARMLADPAAGGRQLVAAAATGVVGWAASGSSRDADRDRPSAGEIYACYVAPEWSGYGLGGRLLRRLLTELAAEGRTEVALWVLAANERARRFYALHGFAPDGSQRSLDLGGPVVEVRCVRVGP